MIQKYDKFQGEIQNLIKFTHFEKFLFIQKWLTKNMWSIGATICFFYKKVAKDFIQKFFHMKKWKRTKKDS